MAERKELECCGGIRKHKKDCPILIRLEKELCKQRTGKQCIICNKTIIDGGNAGDIHDDITGAFKGYAHNSCFEQLPYNEPSSIADGDKSETVGEVGNCPKCGEQRISRGTAIWCPVCDTTEGDEVTLKEGI